MKKTDIFFLIHNYNTVPEELIGYCEDSVERHREWESLHLRKLRMKLGARPPVFLGDDGRF